MPHIEVKKIVKVLLYSHPIFKSNLQKLQKYYFQNGEHLLNLL